MVTAILSLKWGIDTQRVALERVALHIKEKADMCCPELVLAS